MGNQSGPAETGGVPADRSPDPGADLGREPGREPGGGSGPSGDHSGRPSGRPSGDLGVGRAGARRVAELAAGDLARRLRRAGRDYRVGGRGPDGRRIAAPEPVMRGRIGFWSFHSGLTVHATDAVELIDMETRIDLLPSFAVAILLEGEIDARVAGVPVTFAETPGGRGALWSHGGGAPMLRRLSRGRGVRKVIVKVPPDWFGHLHDGGSARPVLAGPVVAADGMLDVQGWQPSLAAIGAAEEILAAAGEDLDMAARMQVEIRGMQILRDAVAALASVRDGPDGGGPDGGGPDGSGPARATAGPHRALAVRDVGRAHAVRDRINAHPEDSLNLKALAQATGMSVSTMQRAFRDCFGESVMTHARRVRLERARTALMTEGISVGDAARRAGYGSPANFATAFQRAFGYPPSRVTRR